MQVRYRVLYKNGKKLCFPEGTKEYHQQGMVYELLCKLNVPSSCFPAQYNEAPGIYVASFLSIKINASRKSPCYDRPYRNPTLLYPESEAQVA